jgi:hypothetical protein
MDPWSCCSTEVVTDVYLCCSDHIISMLKIAGGRLPWRALGRFCWLPIDADYTLGFVSMRESCHNTALGQWAPAAPRASPVTQCLLFMESNNTPNFFSQDMYGLYEPRYRPYDSSASAYAENHRYSEPERPSSRASHYSDQLAPRWELRLCSCFTLTLSLCIVGYDGNLVMIIILHL